MMIDRTDPLPVVKQAKLLGLSRGTVYYLPRATSPADLALMRQIDQLHLEHPFMGQRMLVRQLKRQGVQVGRVHVRTLMQRMGICAMAPQPGTSRPARGHKIYPYLLRNVRVTQANWMRLHKRLADDHAGVVLPPIQPARNGVMDRH